MSAKHAWRRGVLLVALPLAVQLAAAGPASAAGPQPFLAGLTSQTQPVILRLSPDGSLVARAYTTLHLKCTSGAAFYLPDSFTNLDVSKLRHFTTTYSLPPAPNGDTSIALNGLATTVGTCVRRVIAASAPGIAAHPPASRMRFTWL